MTEIDVQKLIDKLAGRLAQLQVQLAAKECECEQLQAALNGTLYDGPLEVLE